MQPATLVQQVKDRLGIKTNYALSKALDISEARLSEYSRNLRTPDNYAIARFAKVLGIDPWTLLKQIEAETEKNPQRREWWNKAASFIVALVLGVNFFVTPTPANARPCSQVFDSTVYYVK